MEINNWQIVIESHKNDLSRFKVDGGYIYRSLTYKKAIGELAEGCSESMCFVPEIDLTRYESHLRDAYTQGYEMGISDTLQKYRIREGRPESEKVKPAEFRRFENVEL